MIGAFSLYTASLHKDDIETVEQVYESVRSDPRPYHVEYRYIRTDGRLIYISETGALSSGYFGTLEDETSMYDNWGWTYTAGDQDVSSPNLNKAVEWEDVHGESETDCAEGALLQWIRTGWRGFWDLTSKWQCQPGWNYMGLWSKLADTKREAGGVWFRRPLDGRGQQWVF